MRYQSVCGVVLLLLVTLSCSRVAPARQAGPSPSRPSDIKVTVNHGGPVVIQTSTAEFQVLPSGYLQAFLVEDGKKLTLDDPRVGAPRGSDYLMTEGQELAFTLDFSG